MISSILSQVVYLLLRLIFGLFIIQLIVTLLVQFDVIKNGRNFALQVSQAIDALMNPILAPIRRRMPATGAIDLSPLVLIVLLQILLIVLQALPI